MRRLSLTFVAIWLLLPGALLAEEKCEEQLAISQKRVLWLQNERTQAETQIAQLWVRVEALSRQLAEAQKKPEPEKEKK